MLATAHPDEAELRLRLAQGAFNLLTAHGTAGRNEQAREIARSCAPALGSSEFKAFLREQYGAEGVERVEALLRTLTEPGG